MHHSGWLENDSVSWEINQVWVGTPIPPKHDYWKGSIAKQVEVQRRSQGVQARKLESEDFIPLKRKIIFQTSMFIFLMLLLRSVPELIGSSDMTQQILQLRMIMGWVAVSRRHCSMSTYNHLQSYSCYSASLTVLFPSMSPEKKPCQSVEF